MTSLAKWLGLGQGVRETAAPLDFAEWVSWFNFQGLQYPVMPSQTIGSKQEEVASSFQGYVEQVYKTNGPVFACMAVRLLLFSEARFQFRQLKNGRPGDLFATKALAPLDVPWPNGTTGDLLKRAIQDADLAGNFYAHRDGKTIRRMRPDWVTIVLGSKRDSRTANWQLDAEVVGYIYHPGGPQSKEPPEVLLVNEVAHFAPFPDPTARFRGMSWLTPVIREIMGDSAATTHKLKFFENGATPNMVVSLAPEITPDIFTQWIEKFEEAHEGVLNAYKTLYLGGGADVKVVGADMRQLDFKVTQGAGETRIAAAAGVPPVIAGFSEGLQSATYSNYQQARRRLADGTMRPLWRDMAHALATIIDVPRGAELWYDDRDIPFLAEDVKDLSEIQHTNSSSIKTLIEAGFDPDSVIDAVTSNDLSRLQHTGLVSVQLQPPGTDPKTGEKTTASPNGNGSASRLPVVNEAERCAVCGQIGGSGMTWTRNNRPVHRWPCLGLSYETNGHKQLNP